MTNEKRCSVAGCERGFYGRGYCSMHWKRWRKTGDPTGLLQATAPVRGAPYERVLARLVIAESGCHEFAAMRQPFGYGVVNVDGVPRLAHRVVWEAVNGPIPEGGCILHRCDNPPCCNPTHLYLGTKLDNYRDMADRGRGWTGRTHCRRGHAYEPGSYYAEGNRRHCKRCMAISADERATRRVSP